MSNIVQLRVDKKIKEEAAKIFQSLGLDLSTGVKVYFQQVLKCKGIPFALIAEDAREEGKGSERKRRVAK